ncbi:MAG: hypothetical protein R3E44_16190 [Paracoccaceae bacterium]
MKTKILIAILAFAAPIAPAFAGPGGCDHERRAEISCADGTSWDDATKSCVTVGS